MIALNHQAPPASILVVEDNPDLIETLAFSLERGGFKVTKARSAHDALQRIDKAPFDLVLLDVMLGNESGLEVCRVLRERKSTSDLPVIFLSAKSEEIDKVVGFEVGADDYITKPFSVKELHLRISAVLRRRKLPEQKPSQFHFGSLSVDFDIPKVTVNNTDISLTSLELRLLQLLYSRQGRVQTRAQLLNCVWKIEAHITTRTVDTHIKRLREKLLSAGAYILTVRGIGYRFITESEMS